MEFFCYKNFIHKPVDIHFVKVFFLSLKNTTFPKILRAAMLLWYDFFKGL